eukprot:TRINITY_DN8545_c0_g1_i1.p1 TRINITY_DN8545_c0_g1~~TRINITY_DN8545_c0_g1_i1.p1  ORF type:complete len:384 (+),score=68.09 TRINITY_DN8545_c0_g1_i1:65-1216(+)
MCIRDRVRESLEMKLDMTFSDKPTKPSVLLSFIDDEFPGLVFDTLLVCSIEKRDPRKVCTVVGSLISLTMLMKIVQVYAKSVVLNAREQTQSPSQDLLQFISTNKRFIEEINGELVELLRKIMVTLSLVIDIDKKTLETLVRGDFLSDEEELRFFENNLRVCTNAVSIIRDNNALLALMVKQFFGALEGHSSALAQALKSQAVFCIVSRGIYKGASLARVGRNFLEYQTIYRDRPCSTCGSLMQSSVKSRYICLICGWCLCSEELQHHVVEFHKGCAVYVSVGTAKLTYYCMTKSVQGGSLYAGRFGNELDLKRDLRSFSLDQKVYEETRDAIINNKIIQKYFFMKLREMSQSRAHFFVYLHVRQEMLKSAVQLSQRDWREHL